MEIKKLSIDERIPNNEFLYGGYPYYYVEEDGIPVSRAFVMGGVLYSVYTLEPYRRRGFARTLIIHILQHEQVRELSVRENNQPAIDLYMSLGFRFAKDSHHIMEYGGVL